MLPFLQPRLNQALTPPLTQSSGTRSIRSPTAFPRRRAMIGSASRMANEI